MADFVGRLLLIERKEVVRWGIGVGEDLRGIDDQPYERTEVVEEKARRDGCAETSKAEQPTSSMNAGNLNTVVSPSPTLATTSVPTDAVTCRKSFVGRRLSFLSTKTASLSKSGKKKPLTPIGVIIKLGSNPRGLMAFALCFAYGLVLGSQEPV
jgi:hypothetical protein